MGIILKKYHQSNSIVKAYRKHVALITALIMLVFSSPISEWFADLCQVYFLNLNSSILNSPYIIKKAYCVMSLLFLMGILVLIIIRNHKLKKVIGKLWDIDKMRTFFIEDELVNKTTYSKFTLVISILSGSFIQLYYIFFGDPLKEGILENITTFLFLVSAVILMMSVGRLHKNQPKGINTKRIGKVLMLFSFILLMIFGEEISWGQHFFEWESSGIFKDYNHQAETNMHNFLIHGLGYYTPC